MCTLGWVVRLKMNLRRQNKKKRKNNNKELKCRQS